MNSRPHGPEPCALPTALHPDMKFYGFAPQNSSIIRASFRSVKRRIHFFQKAPQSAGCGALAGACEDRTHLRGSSPLSPVLKTGGHTSTHLLPYRGRRAPSRFSQLSKMRARSSDITLTAQDPSPVVVFQQQQRVIARGAEHIAKLPQCQRIARFKPRLHARIDG